MTTVADVRNPNELMDNFIKTTRRDGVRTVSNSKTGLIENYFDPHLDLMKTLRSLGLNVTLALKEDDHSAVDHLKVSLRTPVRDDADANHAE